MKKLFLSSSFDDVANRLPAFIGEKLAGKVVTFIPTANVPQDYDGYVLSAKAAFESLGLTIDELEVSQLHHVISKPSSPRMIIFTFQVATPSFSSKN